jgi:hypothetical protein
MRDVAGKKLEPAKDAASPFAMAVKSGGDCTSARLHPARIALIFSA